MCVCVCVQYPAHFRWFNTVSPPRSAHVWHNNDATRSFNIISSPRSFSLPPSAALKCIFNLCVPKIPGRRGRGRVLLLGRVLCKLICLNGDRAHTYRKQRFEAFLHNKYTHWLRNVCANTETGPKKNRANKGKNTTTDGQKTENKKEGEKVKNNCSLSEQLYTLCCARYDTICRQEYDIRVSVCRYWGPAFARHRILTRVSAI